MKLTLGLCLAGLCGAGAALALGQSSLSLAPAPGEKADGAAASTSSSSASDLSPALNREEAQRILGASRPYVAHPQPSTPESRSGKAPERVVKSAAKAFAMAEPPPAPRTETKPPAPAPGYVWVEGHYIPVEGKWRWVRGEWAVPATPISVWIPARYIAEEKRWEPGYWQPDAVPAPPPEHETGKSGAASPPSTATPDYDPPTGAGQK